METDIHDHHHKQQHLTTLQDLPVEMLEMILMKAILELIRSEWEETAYQVSTTMFFHLTTVWSEWYYRITTNWFRIVLKRKLRCLDPSSKYLPGIPERLNATELSVPIWGMTLIDRELFVISMSLPAMMVFDATSLKRCRCHEIDDLKKPRDIASLAHERRLYVVEGGGSPYWINCLNPLGERVTRWDVKSDPKNLSVVPGVGKEQVLVTCNESIKVYSKDGLALREIALENHAPVAWQAVQLSSGNYVICQGFQDVTEYHAVSLLENDGTVAKKFGGQRGSGIHQLSNPFHMAVDADQCIIVVDAANKRVRLFTPRLAHVRDLLTEESLTDPGEVGGNFSISRQCLDSRSGRLYVATNTGKVIVYQMLKA